MWRDVKCKIHNLFARDFQAFANKSLPSHLFFRSISKRGDNLKWAEPTLVAVNNNYCLNNCRFSRDWFGFCWFDNNSVATSNLRSPCFTLQHPHPSQHSGLYLPDALLSNHLTDVSSIRWYRIQLIWILEEQVQKICRVLLKPHSR